MIKTADLMWTKSEGISEVNDESDKDGIIVYTLKRDAIANVELNLYKYTDVNFVQC